MLNATKHRFKSMAALTLSLAIGMTSVFTSAANSQGEKILRMPAQLPAAAREPNAAFEQDILLIMPNAGAESDSIKDALKECKGELVGSMGQGALKVLVVRTEKGKLAQTEAKLRKDRKDFNVIQRNYIHRPNLVPNDPQFASEWHLPAVNAQKAWDITQGQGAKIAVFDSGCQATIADLSGKTEKGYDAHTVEAQIMAITAAIDPLGTAIGMAIDDATGSGARTDATGHGTMVATTAAATDNNSQNGAGVAPLATVVPIHITDSQAMGSDLAIMAGLLNIMMTHKAKIVNISYGNMTDPGHDPAMHAYMAAFHNIYGGIIFVSAGNDSAFLGNGQVNYLNVVSAVKPSLDKADFSNWGNCVTFTAPGVGIVLTDRTGHSVTAAGTSFASPICAGIAALVWQANPGLSNNQVENIMKSTAVRTSSGSWTPFFGFGMPDAFAAVQRARQG